MTVATFVCYKFMRNLWFSYIMQCSISDQSRNYLIITFATLSVCLSAKILVFLLGRYWEMVERLRASHIYLAPTSLRLLLKAGDEYVHKYDRSSLRILACGLSFVMPSFDTCGVMRVLAPCSG